MSEISGTFLENYGWERAPNNSYTKGFYCIKFDGTDWALNGKTIKIIDDIPIHLRSNLPPQIRFTVPPNDNKE